MLLLVRRLAFMSVSITFLIPFHLKLAGGTAACPVGDQRPMGKKSSSMGTSVGGHWRM